MKLIFFIIFANVFSQYSYSQNVFDTEADYTKKVEIDPNRMEWIYLNESKSKYIQFNYENGFVRIEKTVDNENNISETKQFYPQSTKIQLISSMKNGKFSGDRVSFFENGDTSSTCSYNENGLMNGTYISYYINGNTKEEVYLLDGIRIKSLSYYESGELLKEGFFNTKDQRNGEWKYYFKNGDLGIIVELKDDVLIKKTTIKEGYIPNVIEK